MRMNLLAFLAFLAPLYPAVVEAQIDDVPLFRVELRVHTCDKQNAATGDEVWVQLNNGMQRYYLDGAGTDRSRGSWNTYDIVTSDVSSVQDIQYIRLGTQGSDAWCFDSVYLYINRNDGGVNPVNANRIYAIALASTWIDGPGAYPDTHQLNNLRSNLTWESTSQRVGALSAPMDEIRGETIRQMLEDAYGNAMSIEGFMYDWSWSGSGTIVLSTIGFVAGRATMGLRQASSNKSLATTYMLRGNCSSLGGEWTSLFFGHSNPMTVDGVGTGDPALLSVQSTILGAMAAGFSRNLIGMAACAPGSAVAPGLVNAAGDIQW